MGLILGCDLAVLQASIFDGDAFDAGALGEGIRRAAKSDWRKDWNPNVIFKLAA